MRTLLLLAACSLVAIALLVGLALGSDQVRPVPPPPDPLEELLQSGPGLSLLLPNHAHVEVKEESNTAHSEGPSDAFPNLDLSKLPLPVQQAAKEFSDQMRLSADKLISIARRSRSMSYAAALQERNSIWKAANEAYEEFRKEVQNAALDAPEEALYFAHVDIYKIQNLSNQTMLTIAVSHEKWSTAADACWKLGGSNFNHDNGWWDREVYYLRQAGWAGRRTLFLKSVMPYLPTF